MFVCVTNREIFMSEGYHLYVISFTVGAESGLAMVAAQDDKSAFQILKNGGSRYGEGYSLIQCRDIGMSTSCTYGLLLESFVNAREAFDSLVDVINKIGKGEKGDKGDKGDTGPMLFERVNVSVNESTGTPSVDSGLVRDDDGKRALNIEFGGLKGETGRTGVSISSLTQTVESLQDSGRNEITVAFDNNTTAKFYVRNGSRGLTSVTASVDPLPGNPQVYTEINDEGELQLSFYGLKGVQGEPGVNNTIMQIVEQLPQQASEDTADTIYLIYNVGTGEYDRYYTFFNGSGYEFVQMSSTAIDLSEYKRNDSDVWLTQAQFDALPVKDSTKTYNIYEEEEEPVITETSGSGSTSSSDDNLGDTA